MAGDEIGALRGSLKINRDKWDDPEDLEDEIEVHDFIISVAEFLNDLPDMSIRDVQAYDGCFIADEYTTASDLKRFAIEQALKFLLSDRGDLFDGRTPFDDPDAP